MAHDPQQQTPEQPREQQPAEPILILASGGAWQSRFQVSSLIASEAAARRRVDLVLFFAALEAWAQGEWSRIDPEPPLRAEALDRHDFPPLARLVDGARADGLLRVFACSASLRLLDLDPARVQAQVDVIAGWPSFARMIRQSARVVSL